MDETAVEGISQQEYQIQYLRTFLRWAIVIIVFTTIVYGAIYVQRPSIPVGITTLSFAFILPLALGGLRFLNQQRLRLATWIYLIGTLLPATAFTLFASDRLLLVGLIGYILLIRIAIFLETKRTALLYGVICVALYIFTMTVRLRFSLPSVELGQAEIVVLYVLPILGVVLFTLLDQIGTLYLHQSLSYSEISRQELRLSNDQLQKQTDTLKKSKKSLGELAAELEKSNEALHHTNEEMKSFTYIVSHEMRSPLFNLRGFTAELRRDWAFTLPFTERVLPELEPADQQAVRFSVEESIPESLDYIDSAVTRMSDLLESLSKLAKLGRQELVFDLVDMNEVVNSALKSLAHQITAEGINVEVEPLPEIVADYLCMASIMGNLLTNAVKYLDPERSGRIKIWSEVDEEDTVFFIKDNGVGLSDNDLPNLFQPFRRFGDREVPGEGMGLAYVRTLVRRHNGRIWCESELGVGSTFVFSIGKLAYSSTIQSDQEPA